MHVWMWERGGCRPHTLSRALHRGRLRLVALAVTPWLGYRHLGLTPSPPQRCLGPTPVAANRPAPRARETDSSAMDPLHPRLRSLRRRRRAICAKEEKQWQERLARKRQVLAADRTTNELQYHMTRDSPVRQTAAQEGLLRPFLLLVSMSAALRCVLAVQLGICALGQDGFGDPHQEAWAILAHPEAGLRARCRSAWDKMNPFGGLPSWVRILTFVAQEHFVPSYLAWNDIFTSPKLSSAQATAESACAHSPTVAAFECELLAKLAQQQRSKLNKFQVVRVCVRVHARAHTQTHTHAQTHTRTHKHTHTWAGEFHRRT